MDANVSFIRDAVSRGVDPGSEWRTDVYADVLLENGWYSAKLTEHEVRTLRPALVPLSPWHKYLI